MSIISCRVWCIQSEDLFLHLTDSICLWLPFCLFNSNTSYIKVQSTCIWRINELLLFKRKIFEPLWRLQNRWYYELKILHLMIFHFIVDLNCYHLFERLSVVLKIIFTELWLTTSHHSYYWQSENHLYWNGQHSQDQNVLVVSSNIFLFSHPKFSQIHQKIQKQWG